LVVAMAMIAPVRRMLRRTPMSWLRED